MQVLKAIAPNGDIMTFDIPTEATEVTVGQFFECHIAYHAMMSALRHQAETGEDAMGGIPLAAYLNARASSYMGVPTILPEEQVLAIWDEFVTSGSFTPAPGATPWTGEQLAAYFESTFR